VSTQRGPRRRCEPSLVGAPCAVVGDGADSRLLACHATAHIRARPRLRRADRCPGRRPSAQWGRNTYDPDQRTTGAVYVASCQRSRQVYDPRSLCCCHRSGGGVDRTFTHFTDETGAVGITGTKPLAVGDSVEVGQLSFGKGQNNFLANAPGDNFVTDLPSTATPGQLNPGSAVGGQARGRFRGCELV
jgi:hypothetical protein